MGDEQDLNAWAPGILSAGVGAVVRISADFSDTALSLSLRLRYRRE